MTAAAIDTPRRGAYWRVIGGVPVLVKYCGGCERVLPASRFANAGRGRGPTDLRARCRPCERDRDRARYAANRERVAAVDAARHRRYREDPEAWAIRLDQMREAHRRWAQRGSPAARRARAKNAARCSAYRKRRQAQDPGFFTAERVRVRRDRGRRSVEMVDATPFRHWLYAYALECRAWSEGPSRSTLSVERLALELGLGARSVRRVLRERQGRIALERVDLAVQSAVMVAHVDGQDVLEVFDLYPASSNREG